MDFVFKRIVFVALAAFIGCADVRAEFLFEGGFLVPPSTTDWYHWGGFTSAHTNPNYVTGYGAEESGVFSNPTLTQLETNAIIIGGGTGDPSRIYSFLGPTRFLLGNTASYEVGMVALQFRTLGSLADFSSISLVYRDADDVEHVLSPDEYLKEYQSHYQPGRGFSAANQSIFQWDLTGLGVVSYTITLNAASASMSLREVMMDVSGVYDSIVPEARSWQTAGTGNWSDAAHWLEGSTSVENGNVKFIHQGGAADVVLDADRKVGEIVVETPEDLTISSPDGHKIALYTGISTTVEATGRTLLEADIALEAYSLFQINAGRVEMAGEISGAYGIFKQGDGMLVLKGENTFTGSLGIQGGSVRIEGSNSYAEGTTLVSGTLLVAHDSFAGKRGALGTSSQAFSVYVGADSVQYAHQEGDLSAALIIDGDYTVEQGIDLVHGTNKKTLGSMNSAGGATFAGPIGLSSLMGGHADNVHFTTAAATDKLTFSGAIAGGTKGNSVTVSGPGTVIYSGADKTYQNKTVVSGGTLLLEGNFTGGGDMSVAANSRLIVNGALRGNAALHLASGAVLGGNGRVERAFILANGAILDPGDGVGLLTTGGQTWDGGGIYRLDIGTGVGGMGVGWDGVAIEGGLAFGNDFSQPFEIVLSYTGSGAFDRSADGEWLFVTASGGIANFESARFLVNTEGLGGAGALGDFEVLLSDEGLVLAYTAAIPEPASFLFVGAGGVVLYGLMSRRRKG